MRGSHYPAHYQPMARPNHGNFIAETRYGLRLTPEEPKESYLAAFAVVGILGGVTLALLWRMFAPS